MHIHFVHCSGITFYLILFSNIKIYSIPISGILHCVGCDFSCADVTKFVPHYIKTKHLASTDDFAVTSEPYLSEEYGAVGSKAVKFPVRLYQLAELLRNNGTFQVDLDSTKIRMKKGVSKENSACDQPHIFLQLYHLFKPKIIPTVTIA